MYLLEAGAALYLECSPLLAHVKEALQHQSVQMWKDWHAAYWKEKAYRVEVVGTIWCEGALFVRWIYTGELNADPNTPLSLLVLEGQVFEDLVATFTEVEKALSAHATRVCAFLAKSVQVTDLFRSEDMVG